MKRLIRFFPDPAIGSPALGWAIRFMSSPTRGFGIYALKWDGLHLALWWTWRIELVRIPANLR